MAKWGFHTQRAQTFWGDKKFKHQKIIMAKVIASKSTTKSIIFRRNLTRNWIMKIYTPKVIASKSTPKLMAKSRRTICPLAYRSDDTPKLIALKSTLKSMIFRWNSSRNWSTKNHHAKSNCIKIWIRNSYSDRWRNHAKITRKWNQCCKKSSKIWSLKIRHAEGNCTKTKVKKWKINCTFLRRFYVVDSGWVGCWVSALAYI